MMMVEVIPILPTLVVMSALILIAGFFSKKFRQPYVISYIIAGLLLGPSVFGLMKDTAVISAMGNIGILLLLFFIGMEIDLKKLLSGWRFAIFGTLFQIIISILAVWVIGYYSGWGIERIVLIGFVISLSSTAVVLKILEEWKETDTHAGRNVVSILLAQDLAFIPMIIILGFLDGESLNYTKVGIQALGMILMFAIILYIFNKKQISLPLSKYIKSDHEMQVFLAITLCFGMSLLSEWFQLSAALGAFIAGIIISASKETKWVHDTLNPFRVFFVALFFIYVGTLIDLTFLKTNWTMILGLVLIVFLSNTFINALIIFMLNNTWRDSLYAGAMLGQIGEFSFLLVAIGLSSGLISIFDYQITVQVIALTLLLSPAWILFNKKMICHINRFNRPNNGDGDFC